MEKVRQIVWFSLLLSCISFWALVQVPLIWDAITLMCYHWNGICVHSLIRARCQSRIIVKILFRELSNDMKRFVSTHIAYICIRIKVTGWSLSYFLLNGYTAIVSTWWRHQMETFFALLAICAGNSPVPGEFPTQRPVTRSFDVYFDLRLNKRLCKQSWGWWFETLLCPLWRHSNELEGSSWNYTRYLNWILRLRNF